jgi:protein-tyrosine phosphatase
MTSHCSIENMLKAAPFTEVYPNLFMGSKRAIMNHYDGDFDVYVSTAAEIKPPTSIRDDFRSYHIRLDDTPWDFVSHPNEVVELVAIAKDLAVLVQTGHKVLIFCHMGMNRSGLMTALTLMQLGLPWDQALANIRQRHGCALSNQSFVDVLPFAEIVMQRKF